MTNGVSLKEIKRSLIKNEISQCEKLINHLRSPSFQLEFNIGRFWFDDAINQIEKKCKNQINSLKLELDKI